MRATAWVSWGEKGLTPEGDEIVPPIGPNEYVEILRKNGEKVRGTALVMDWNAEAKPSPIVAYRVVWEW